MDEERDNSKLGYNTRLIDDIPSDVDDLGGHTEIAHALSNLIIEEKGGKSIALAGEFGSGKSTVIRLLDNELNTQNNDEENEYGIFTYDAWKHQKDPLRRSFIEELHSFLKMKGWIDDKFDEKIEIIQKKKEITTNKTEPKLTKAGKITAIASFFAPIILLLLSTLIDNAIGANTSGWNHYWTSLLIIISLFWIVPAVIILWYVKKQTEEHITDNSKSKFDPFNIFIKKTYTTSRDTTIRFPDPTAIEFRKLFGDLVDKTLSDKERNLIIVIDNLDRLTTENGVEIWARLMTFLNQQNLYHLKSKDKIWVITPFDYFELQKNWDETGSTNLKEFVDKTFQLVYRVPKPVIVDWKKFLQNTLTEVFPEITDEETHKIYRLYQIINVRRLKNGLPTPRRIKRFVNDLSGLHRRWKNSNEITIVIQAFYYLISDSLSQADINIRSKIEEYNSTNILSLLDDENWIKYTLALHYNIEPSKAYHVILSEPLREALEEKDEDKVLELAEYEGFYEVLEDVLESVYPKEIHAFNNTLIALDTLGEPKKPSHINSWKTLGARFLQVEKIDYLKEPVGNGLTKLLIHLEDLRTETMKKVINLFSNLETNDITSSVIPWGETIFTLLEYVDGNEELKETVNSINTPFNKGDFVELISHLSKRNYDQKLYQYLTTNLAVKDILEEFKGRINDNSLTYLNSRSIKYFKLIEGLESISWHPYVSHAINSKLKPNSKLNKDQFGSILESFLIIFSFYDDKKSNDSLMNNNVHNSIAHWLFALRDDIKSSSRAILFELIFNPSLNIGNNGNSNRGKQHIVDYLNNPSSSEGLNIEIFELIKRLNITDEFLSTYKQHEYKALLMIINLIGQDENVHTFITPKTVILNFDIWVKALNSKNLNNLIQKQTQFNDLVSYVIENEIFSSNYHRLIDLTIRYADQKVQKPKLIDFISKKLRDLSYEEWYEVLSLQTQLLELLVYLRQNYNFPTLTQNFVDAFEDYSIGLAEGEIEVPRKIEEIHSIAVQHYGEKKIVQFIIKKLKSFKTENRINLIKTFDYKNLLSTSSEFENHSDVLLSEVFTSMLDNMNPDELTWINKAFKETNIYNKCSRSEKRIFIDKIRKEYFEGGHSNEIIDQLKKISNSAGFDIHNTTKYDESG